MIYSYDSSGALLQQHKVLTAKIAVADAKAEDIKGGTGPFLVFC